MSEFNKSYRIRTEVGKDTHIRVNLDRKYEALEIMSLKINQENAYKSHTSNYGVIAGRVLANDAFGIPNAKISVFINIDENDINDTVKSVLYPYNTTSSMDSNGVRYNLSSNEQINDCHTIIGTFPEKQYMLDNDSILEVFDKYYKYTTRTNNAGDYMIFGVPVGSQTVHVDVDLSDIGILSQKPRDMVYKGYNIEQFENANKFKYGTGLDSLTQVISQDNIAEVIPFWGDEEEGSIGITRCDINMQYKFEPTCVFMGSIVSDTASNGISKKCIPTPGMGAMDEVTTGSGTIEMIRKTPEGNVEEFQIKGTQLINGDGVWCYQIPMNLDFVMTDEFGNMVPTNNPEKGIPTRTRVRFRITMQDFENDNSNIFRCKMLVPHNPNVYSNKCDEELDYQFGTLTKDDSYRDLFWNGVYSVKSYIPRIQKGSNWKNEKFTGFKRVNYYGNNNPIPYNNIRIRIPFIYTMVCTLIKTSIRITGFLNRIFKLCGGSFINQKDDDGINKSGSFLSLSGEICSENLEQVCIIPGVDIQKIASKKSVKRRTLLGMAIVRHYEELGGDIDVDALTEDDLIIKDVQSIDYENSNFDELKPRTDEISIEIEKNGRGKKTGQKFTLKMFGITVTDKVDYFIQCIEMNLAQEYRVIQFDFYNDWINGLIYIPRWVRNIRKKRSYLWGLIKVKGKIRACNENYKSGRRNLVQQCGLTYDLNDNNVSTPIGCKKNKLRCHKDAIVRKTFKIFKQGGIVQTIENMQSQYLYYFKPYEYANGKNVRLFSTDIILLGTLNDCDKWGIPNNLSELVSSTYQMPPNLALTDSDLEGNEYESKNDDTKFIKLTYATKKAEITNIDISRCYVGINPMEEDGNYTELSGVNWDYTGPLQEPDKSRKDSKFYKPGGHFLGISCRNSATNVKTCVNLTRICEHGVWMSQRQELNIPSTSPIDENSAFQKDYTIVPSGFISKDEISDTNYRRLFATMNKNRLRTVYNPESGYLMYDFEYVNPTNFAGELKRYTQDENVNMNRKITDIVNETYYNYTDDDYFERELDESIKTYETQIMRTGEYLDTEYYKYRFGLKDSDLSNETEKVKRYLGKIEIDKNRNKSISFPIYDNSFYFYFGLHDGKTALDEFKKTYYAVCSKKDDLVQIDKSIKLQNLKNNYDGVCDNSPSGSVEFDLIYNESLYDSNGLNLTLKDDTGSEIKTINSVKTKDKVLFNKLKSGTYKLEIKENSIIVDTMSIDVKNISITSSVIGNDFIIDVSNTENDLKSNIERFKLDRSKYGGYIKFTDNMFYYENNDNVLNENIFTSKYVKEIRIENANKSIVYSNTPNMPTRFTYAGTSQDVTKNANGEYMIPVPLNDETYNVYVDIYIGSDCKPTQSASNKTHTWLIGSAIVRNAIPLRVLYNGVAYDEVIAPYDNGTSDELSTSGWWNAQEPEHNWLNEDKDSQWLIKEALYSQSLSNPHRVTISVIGGVAPYKDVITGMKEDLSTTTDITRSDFENVTKPTLNYLNNGKRRNNFSYQVVDLNNQKMPQNPFVFPVIYKPFFMEIGVFYFDEINKFYLCGNVYNGITWDYKTSGFNNVKLNNVPLANLCTITKDDTVMEIDEPSLTNEKGGYDYFGEFSKYNGRKTKVTREIDGATYGLTNYGLINYFDLSVGCEHIEDEGETYSNYTSSSRSELELFKFNFKTKKYNDKYYIKMEESRPNYSTKCDLYCVFDSDENGYKYPWNGKSVDVDDKLFRDLMNNSIKSSTGITTTSIEQVNGYIDVNLANNENSGKIFYIAVPNNEDNLTNSSNDESKIKGISISNLINLKSLSKFYPLSINIDGTDSLTTSGKYSTIYKN